MTALDGTLRAYQLEGVRFLSGSTGALLADDMGLGKTIQAIAALRLVLRRPGIDRALVIAPASLTLNWQRELEVWAPDLAVRRLVGSQGDRMAYYDLPVAVLVATYEQVSLDALDRVPAGAFDVVILDEAQRIKNRGSRTALACRLLPREIAWALTGTPIENSRADMESVFAFLRPGLLGDGHSRKTMLSRIAPHFLRRHKDEVLPELPPIIVQDMPLELTAGQRRAYDAAWDGGSTALRREARPVSATALLALITTLKQICNFGPQEEASCKVVALQVLLESAAARGTKVLVFSQYVETLRRLAQAIRSMPVCIYSGDQSAADRDKALRCFASDTGARALLMSLRAGGVGLNIPSADLVVLFDRWWNPAVEAQAINRAHRLGRSRTLHVVRFLVRDSVEERIDSILTAKRRLFRDYVEAIENAKVATFTRDDLIRALGMSHEHTEVVS